MTKRILTLFAVALTLSLITACSNDDDNVVDPVVGEINVLLIQSDNGKTSTGTMYKSGETYNPPHCYLGKEIRYNGGNELIVYHMGLNISFESNQPMSFSNLKAGDTFDSSQFHAAAAYTPTWMEDILIQATALSGKVTVIGTSKVGDKSYMTLRLTNFRFDAIDHTCVYTVNGTVDYEIWDIQYE